MFPAIAVKGDKAKVKIGPVVKTITNVNDDSLEIQSQQRTDSLDIAITDDYVGVGDVSVAFSLAIEDQIVDELKKGKTHSVFNSTNENVDSGVELGFIATQRKKEFIKTFTFNITKLQKIGKLKVISFDQSTKKLKFKLNAKAKEYTLITTDSDGMVIDSKVVNKKLPIKILCVVSLDE